jgi:hypothetical protein
MILYLFPHQDDELFLLPTIQTKLKDESIFIFLTDGSFYGSNLIERNNESSKVLNSIGVLKKDIIFLNQKFPIQDTKLVDQLENCINQLIFILDYHNINEIYFPSWEGGHPDHDATFLIGLALAKKYKVESIFQFSLYNSFKVPSKFFRVMSPVNKKLPIIVNKFNLLFGIKISLLCRFYKTQWKTWLALFPFVVIQFIILRKVITQKLNFNIKISRPHEGLLYYEKRKWITFEEFMKLSELFRNKYNLD